MQSPLQIVIVDHSPTVRNTLQHALRQGLEQAFTCHEAHNGEQALHLYHQRQAQTTVAVDILLLAQRLPDMDGGTLLQKLKGSHPSLPFPVVIVTDTAQEEEAQAALAVGAQDFIVKSQLTPELVTHVVRNATMRFRLSQKRQASEEQTKERVEARLDNSSDSILLVDRAPCLPQTNHTVDRLAQQITDITALKQAQEAIHQSEQKYRHLVETMRGGLLIADLEGRITYVNDRLCTMVGYSYTELIGTLVFDHVDEENARQLDAQAEKRERIESTAYELIVIRKDRQRIHLLVSGSPLLNEQGTMTGTVAVLLDIGLQKQAESALREALAKEKELVELKSRFIAMASHEFRTPLTVINTTADTLLAYRHKLSNEQIDTRLCRIQAQVFYLKEIMDDMLQLSRLQARHIEPNATHLDCDALCRVIIDELQNQPGFTHRIIYHCDAVSREVVLDNKVMRQIMNNLLSNAIKYSPAGKSVEVTLDYLDDTLILKVRDEGIGIPAADLPYLFQPFHRGDNVGTIAGTGLGLTIAKESVALQGGTLTVASQVGVGTTFTASIPLGNS